LPERAAADPRKFLGWITEPEFKNSESELYGLFRFSEYCGMRVQDFRLDSGAEFAV